MLYATPELNQLERDVLEDIKRSEEKLVYSLSQPRRWTGHLRRTAGALHVRASNTIEGYQITIEDTLALAADEEPLDANRETQLAVRGYQRAMTYVLQLSGAPGFEFSLPALLSLHFMMLEHDLSKNPGRLRPGWVAVRDAASGELVHEGAEADELEEVMSQLIERLNTETEQGIDPVISAAMAHLNLVLIHPFADGNGRMARCLQTLVLTRHGALAPEFCSIEEYLGANTPAYYAVLAEVGGGTWNPSRDARAWIRFVLRAHHRQAATLAVRQREIQKLWTRLEEEVHQRKLPERTILALIDAANGWKVRNPTYRQAAEVSANTASRDLQALVQAGLLEAHGEKKGRFYKGSPALDEAARKVRESRAYEDPFA